MMMLNNPRSRPPANGCSGNKRNGFIGDKSTLLILQTPSDKQWGSHFTDLKNQLKAEFAEMPNDIRISKVFATLRGLCFGPEVAISLNAFEHKYYDMEYRIKSQKKDGHSRSNSSESTVDLAIKCVLDENSSAELSDVVDLNHIFGLKNSMDESVHGTGYSTPRKHQSTYGHRAPNGGVDYLDDDASSSPYSDSTILRPKCHNQTYPRLALPRSSSTHYLSPSALSSPAILRLEAFSPMLSPVRENKSVEEIWRDESLYIAPLPHTPKVPGPRPPSPPPHAPTNEPASRIPPPYQRISLACPPESSRVTRKERHITFPQSGSSPTLMNIGQDKALPPIPQISSSPDLKRESFLATLKNRSSSGPASLRDDPKKSMIARLRSPRTPSIVILPLSPAVTIRKHYPKKKIAIDKTCGIDRRSFEGLGSRTPTPTGRVADNRTVQDKHRSMESGMRSSYISIKTSRTTVSESPVKTSTQYPQSTVSTPPTKATTNRPELSTLNYDLDSSPEQSGRYSNRTSITPSLLSSPGRGGSFRSEGEIYEDKKLHRENSATSTILSAATNSTGDIPNLAPGISLDSSVRRVPGTPRLIEVTKNVYGGSFAVPLDKGASLKQPRIVSDTSTRSTMYSMKSVDMVDEVDVEARPLVNEAEKKADSATKSISSYGSSTKIPNFKHSNKKAPLYENDLKAKYPPRKFSKRSTGAIQGGLDGTKKEPELKKPPGQNTGTKEIPETLVSRALPKPRVHGANQKLAIGRPDGRQQKNSNTGAKPGGMGNSASSLVGSNQRVSGTGNGIGQKNASVSGVEKNYMRPLAKDKLRQNAYSPLSRTQCSGNVPTLPKPPSRPGGQLPGNRRIEQATLTDRRSSDSLRGQGTLQDTTSKDKPLTTAGTKNGSKPSLNDDPKVDTTSKLTTSPTVVESLNPPTNPKKPTKDRVLADITGIGCGSNPRTTPISGRNWFGRRGVPTITRPIGSSFIHLDSQKENARPYMDNKQQYLQPTTTTARTPKSKSKPLGNLTSWLSRGSPKPSPTELESFLKGAASRKTKGKYSPLPPSGQFSKDEVDDLIKRLSAQIPQTPNEKNGFNALGGRYYTLNIPSLDKSPSKDEKDSNPIAVCMDLINAASNEPQSPRRERLLQMSRVMVDAVSKSRDAECAAEEAKMAAGRAEVAFLETRRHLAEMAELMKNRKQDI